MTDIEKGYVTYSSSWLPIVDVFLRDGLTHFMIKIPANVWWHLPFTSDLTIYGPDNKVVLKFAGYTLRTKENDIIAAGAALEGSIFYDLNIRGSFDGVYPSAGNQIEIILGA